MTTKTRKAAVSKAKSASPRARGGDGAELPVELNKWTGLPKYEPHLGSHPTVVAKALGTPADIPMGLWPTLTPQAGAHYFTPYPLSFNNEAALPDAYTTVFNNPNVNTTFTLHGVTVSSIVTNGMFRDRPIFTPKQAAANWSDLNFQAEVRQAKSMGLDFWTMDLLTLAQHVTRQNQVLAAADAVGGFKIMLMPDMNSWRNITADTFGTRIAALVNNHNSCFKLPDGRLVICPFLAENWTVSQWNAAIASVESKTGLTVAFIPCFLNYSGNIGIGTVGSTGNTGFMAVTRIYGATIWGGGSPATQTGVAALCADAHSKGMVWMTPIRAMDVRVDQDVYDEAANTKTLRDGWGAAMGFTGGIGGTPVTNGKADLVHNPTWNDYSEGAHMCPSTQHGYTYLSLQKHYLMWWKTGTEPTPAQDEIYLTCRPHNHSVTSFSGGQTEIMALRGGSTAAQDLIEVVTILTASAPVSIYQNGVAIKTQTQAAGVQVMTTALVTGKITAAVNRAGTTALNVQLPQDVTATPVKQDLGYLGGYAIRIATTVGAVKLGCCDSSLPSGLLDTLEGGGANGLSMRVPFVHEVDGFTAGTAAFGAGTREVALFNAGHSMLVSIRAPSGAAAYTDITSGTYDTQLNALGDAINALSFGVAVSGAQPAAAYGGLTDTAVRLAFDIQMDTKTSSGTAAQYQAAHRYIMAKIKSRLSNKARVIPVWIPTAGAFSNGKALTYFPGVTTSDYVDEIGCNTFPAVPYTTFAAAMSPIKTWIAANAPGRKIAVGQMNVHQDPGNAGAQAAFYASIVTEMQANPTAYSVVALDSLPSTAPDDRSLANTVNPTTFAAFKAAVAAAAGTGAPPPDLNPPGIPQTPACPTATSTGCTVTWNDPTDPDLVGVNVYDTIAGVRTLVGTVAKGVGQLVLSGLPSGSDHSFTFASFDGQSPPNQSVDSVALPVQLVTTVIGPPVITSASMVMQDSTVTFAATATDPAAGALAYSWDMGDGTVLTSQSGTYTYAAPGIFQALLTVTSGTSNLPSTDGFQNHATFSADDLTAFHNWAKPIPDTDVGQYGDAFRDFMDDLDDRVNSLETTEVQTGDGTPIQTAPVVSYRGGVDVSADAPSTAYPGGRLFVTARSPNELLAGETTLDRGRDENTTAAVALVSQQVRFTYFEAKVTEAITQLRLLSGNVAATGVTLIRVGLYSVDPTTGLLTLVSAIANDATLYAAAMTAYTKTLTSTFNKVAGVRYAFAQLVVATGVPTVTGRSTIAGGVLTEAAQAPRMGAVLSGKTDLPATATDASLTASASLQYAVLVP